MPELPEVEAARRAIEENCIGKKIIRCIIADDTKVIDVISHSDFEASVTGKTIVSVHRKGKNMWIHLDSPPFPSFQFGMAGAIYIKGVAVTKYKRSAVNDSDEWPSKYSKLFIELDDGVEVSFTDKRRFAKVRLLQKPAAVAPISQLGPDALLEPMTQEELSKALSKKKIGIKALLLDQSFIAGVGNWIADEVLYQARIHPLQSAASVSKEECAALHNSLKEVIEQSVEVGADSSQFPTNWLYHSREKKPGKAFVDGKKIEFITAGGRTSAYVPEFQKLSGDQATKTPVKSQKKSNKKSKDEEIVESAKKPKGGKKPSQSKAKKPPAKRKSNSSDDANDSEEDDEAESEDDKKPAPKKKPNGRTGNKRAPAKKKPQESGSDSDEVEEEEEAESEEDSKVEVKGKKAAVQKSQSGRQIKKRAR